jgi:hypothetical protein
MTDVAPDNYKPTNGSAIDNFDINNGVIYKAADPLLSTTWVNNPPPEGGHPCLRLADSLVGTGAGQFQRIIIVSNAIGGMTIATFAAGEFSGRLPVTMARLRQRGIVCGSTNVTCAILWGQGESDCSAGTSQASYEASFATLYNQAAAAGA